jgi:hypothetical protein
VKGQYRTTKPTFFGGCERDWSKQVPDRMTLAGDQLPIRVNFEDSRHLYIYGHGGFSNSAVTPL